MKTIIGIIITIIIAITALSSCTQHSCPTYGQNDLIESDDEEKCLFI